jgi:GDP-L-fucose synthase
MSPRIAVLGGTGFVGQNLLAKLKQTHGVYFTASRSEGVDLRDPAQVRDFLAKSRPDFIVNCAAHVGSLNYVTEQAATVVSDNSRLILSLYEAIAAEALRVIVINPIANCSYPADATTFEEDRWWSGHLHRSVLSYGGTRRMLWVVAECFQMQHGIRSIHLLVPNMYGPHDSTDPNKAHALNALAAKFVKAKATAQKEVVIWGTGVAVREWLYAPDFARVIQEVIKRPDTLGLNEPLNVGQNFGVTVRELVDLVSHAVGYSGSIRFDPSMPDGAPRKVMDDRRFRKVFPNFVFTTIDTGLRRTIEYYEQIYPFRP